MSIVIEKPSKNAKVMTSEEFETGIDLSKADDKTTEEILSKASSSLSVI